MRRPRVPVALLALLGYAALACALVVPAAARGLPGSAPDAGLYVWWLKWVPHALAQGTNPLHSDAVLAPGGVNAMWNTSILLPSLLLAPITVLAGPVVSYAVLVTLAPALSAWAAFAAVRRLVPGTVPALVGGLLYGFSPYVVAHSLGHPNLALAWFPPVALLLLDRILRGDHPRRDGALLGLAAAAQLLCGEELLLTTGLAAVVCLAVLGVQHRDAVRAAALRLLPGLGAAIVVFAVLAAAPLAYQFLGPDRVTGRVQQSIFGNDIDAFVVPSSLQLFAPQAALDHSASFAGLRGVPVEVNAYLGIPLLLLLLLVPRLLRGKPIARFALPSFAILAVLSLGAHARHGGALTSLPLPWIVVDHVPVLNDVVPPRLMVHAWLLLALLVAALVARRRPAILAAVAVALLALVPRALPSQTARTPQWFTTDARSLPAGTVVLVAPWADVFDTRAMVWQAAADMRFRMPGGFLFGAGPAQHPDTLMEQALGSADRGVDLVPLSDSLRRGLSDELHREGAQLVVATTEPEVRLLSDLLGGPPARSGGVALWRVG
jgi:hypothetical protein